MPTKAEGSWLARWRRRSLTISCACIGWLLLTLGSPLFLLYGACLDVLIPLKPWSRTRAILAIWWILSCECLGLLLALLLYGGHLLVRNPKRFAAWNAALQRRWTEAMFSGARRIYRLRIEATGLEHGEHGPYLLLVRHASVIDTLLAATLIANRHDIHLRYVLKDELLWDPCLDVVGSRLRNAFVSRGRGLREHDLEAVRSLTEDLSPTDSILIYPEGTRFSESKRQRAVERLAQAHDKAALHQRAAQLRHVLPPRPGGVEVLRAAAPTLDVLVLAHTGLEVAVSLADFWRGELLGATIRAELRRIPADEVPASAPERITWLYDQWLEVDRWVAQAKGLDPKERRAG